LPAAAHQVVCIAKAASTTLNLIASVARQHILAGQVLLDVFDGAQAEFQGRRFNVRNGKDSAPKAGEKTPRKRARRTA
jgi:hypothetical protein